MALTAKQQAFGITPEWVCQEIIKLMFSATRDTDKSYSANMISRMHTVYYGDFDKNEVDQMVSKYNKLYLEKQTEFNRMAQKRRHARIKDKRENDFSFDDWCDAVEYFDRQCAYCGEQKHLTQEHFVPFSKGGSFSRGNIIPVCKSCNSSKRDRQFEDWFPKQEFHSEERVDRIKRYLSLVS